MSTLRAWLAVPVLLVGLTACGSGDDGPSDADRRVAEDFCGSTGKYSMSGMGIDRYENPEGFDRCVEDASKVTECLDTPASTTNPWVPPDCNHDGYDPSG